MDEDGNLVIRWRRAESKSAEAKPAKGDFITVLVKRMDEGVLSDDYIKFRVTKGGMSHGADRRLKSNGSAIVRIGDILNASVPVPFADGQWRYRIASTNFGAKGYCLITAKVVNGKEEEIVDVQTLHSLNLSVAAERPQS